MNFSLTSKKKSLSIKCPNIDHDRLLPIFAHVQLHTHTKEAKGSKIVQKFSLKKKQKNKYVTQWIRRREERKNFFIQLATPKKRT